MLETSTCHRTRSDENHLPAKKVEMAWPCAKNGAHSTCKNCTDMDSLGTKEKGTPKNNMELNGELKKMMRSAGIC